MAIAYDSANIATAASGASVSTSVTATGADRFAIISVCWESATYSAPSSVTVGGSSTGVTLVGSIAYYTGNRYVAIYRLVAPPTSLSAYVANFTGSVDEPAIGVVTYTGVDQTTPTNGSASAVETSGEAPTITISSATGELVVAAMAARFPAVSATEDGAQTERCYAADWGGSEAVLSVCEKAGAASVTESWTLGGTGSSWGIYAVRIAAVATSDTTPDAFTFTDQTNVALSTNIESAAITVAGINAAAAISVSGGEYKVNAGSWTSTAGNVNNGDSVYARHTSSASYSTATNTTVTIGGVSDTFTSTTAAYGYNGISLYWTR